MADSPNDIAIAQAMQSAPPALVAGIDPGQSRDARCMMVAEDSSEFTCRFRARDTAGKWVARTAIVARNGNRWVLLDLAER